MLPLIPLPAYFLGVLQAAPAPFLFGPHFWFLKLPLLLLAAGFFFQGRRWLCWLTLGALAFLAGHQWGSFRFIQEAGRLPPEEEFGQSLRIRARIRNQWQTDRNLAVSLDRIEILSPQTASYHLPRLIAYLPKAIAGVEHRSTIVTWVTLRRRHAPQTITWPMMALWDQYRPTFYGSVKSELLIESIETIPADDSPLNPGNRQLQSLFLEGRPSSVWRDRLQPFGLGHLLAISGLHCLWVFLLIQLLLLPLRDPLWRTLLTCLGLVWFAHHIGWTASVSRATVMLVLWQCLPILNRPRRRYHCWAFLFSAAAIIHPLQVLSQGYWYTFAASLGIILAARPLEDSPMIHPMRYRIKPLLPILGAQLMVIPIQLIFGVHAPLASVLWNLLASILLLAMIVLFGLGLLVRLIAFPASIVNWLENQLGDGLIRLAAALPDFELVRFPHNPTTVFVVLLALTLVLFFGLREIRWYAALLVLVFFGSLHRPLNGTRTIMLDVGQGSAMVHIDRNRQAWLLDAGGSLPRGIRFCRLIRLFGGKTVAAAILSHDNRDHFQLLPQLDDAFPIYLPDGQAHRFRRRGDLRRGRCQIPLSRGDTLAIGSLKATVLLPKDGEPAPDTNEGSLVLLIDAKWGSLLFTGDAGLWAESRMAVPARGGVRWLQVGHHGSRSATGPRLLDAFNPHHALISAGRRNQFGHPHPVVATRLRQHGITIRATYREGSIQIDPIKH